MSSTNLDKSLDEIIGSEKAERKAQVNRARNTKKASKHVNMVRRQPAARNQRPLPGNVRNPAARMAKVLNANQEVKMNVEGLPRDIKQDAVREFFASQVGGVHRVLLSYNERGYSTGIATVTFKNTEQARKAVSKFNGAPIDGGQSRLKLTLIVDPTQRPARTLSDRIQPVGGRNLPQRNVAPRNIPQKPVRGPNKKAAVAKAQNKAKKASRARPEKKSLEDLDKEMADYFEEKK